MVEKIEVNTVSWPFPQEGKKRVGNVFQLLEALTDWFLSFPSQSMECWLEVTEKKEELDSMILFLKGH
jgi:hypothetical protein